MINLISTKRLSSIRIAKNNTILSRYIILLASSALALGIIIIGAMYFLGLQHSRASDAKKLDDEQLAELESYHEKAQHLSKSVKTIEEVLSTEVSFSGMLTQIGELMPEGAALTGIQLSTEDLAAPLVVSAHVDNEQRSGVLLSNLNQSDLFERAQIRNIQFIDSETRASSRYNYVVSIEVYLTEKPEEKK